MFQNPEQFATATKTLFEFQLDTFNTLTNRAMQGVEQAVALNIATARKALDDQIDASRKVNASVTPQEALNVINARLQPSFAYANSDDCVFPMAIKAMLRVLGQEAGECRLPLPPTPPGTQERARAVWAALNG